MESSGARPEHGPDKGHRGRCTRRQGISRPGSLSLSFSLLSSPLHSSPSAYTHKHTHTYESHGAQFRSVPFVRYERTYPVPFLSSSPLPSSHLASPRLSPPLTPSPRSLSWLRQPRYALLPQTQPRFNPDFVSNKRWIRGIYSGLYGK